MRIGRFLVLLVVVGMGSGAQAIASGSGFSLEAGPDFARGLDDSNSGGSHGFAAGCAFGAKTSERLWLGAGLGVSLGSSGDWGDVPRVYNLFAGGRWWFAGRDKLLYVPAFLALSHLTREHGFGSQTWLSPSLSAGLGMSMGEKAGMELRYFRAFDTEKRSYRETSLDYSSVGLFFVYTF